MSVEDPFVELMEDVGCYGGEDVAVWKLGPEWMRNGAKTLRLERSFSSALSTSSVADSLQGRSSISTPTCCVRATLVPIDKSNWAAVLHRTRYEALFRMIGDVGSEERVDMPHPIVGADDLGTLLTCSDKRTEEVVHRGMEDFIILELTR